MKFTVILMALCGLVTSARADNGTMFSREVALRARGILCDLQKAQVEAGSKSARKACHFAYELEKMVPFKANHLAVYCRHGADAALDGAILEMQKFIKDDGYFTLPDCLERN